jgi:two-component system NarL family sensor kinase
MIVALQKTPLSPTDELVALKARLAETEAALQAISLGEVDTVMVQGQQGPQVFSLNSAEQAYRMLIESMNEGALILTEEAVILYANQCFAKLVHRSLEQVQGSSFYSFLDTADQKVLRQRLKRRTKVGSKMKTVLLANNHHKVAAQISLRSLSQDRSQHATLGMVVTDLTEAQHNEDSLRALNNRMVEAQETERCRVASELHDGITQLLCGLIFHSQVLINNEAAHDAKTKQLALKLNMIASKAANEVESISRNLRPGVLIQLGLVAALNETVSEFEKRSGISVNLVHETLTMKLPPETELALYRIFQEALRNVEKHAHASKVKICLLLSDKNICLVIQDDGVGFEKKQKKNRQKISGLGLLSMRERVSRLGGSFKVQSGPKRGTKIEACLHFLS